MAQSKALSSILGGLNVRLAMSEGETARSGQMSIRFR
jgi:hypothetical protein